VLHSPSHTPLQYRLHPFPGAGRASDVSYAVLGTPADEAFGAFTSLGGIYLLFGLTVLLEIQVISWVGVSQ